MSLFLSKDIHAVSCFSCGSSAVPFVVDCIRAGYAVRVYESDPAVLADIRSAVAQLTSRLSQVIFTDDPSGALMDVQFVQSGVFGPATIRLLDTYTSPKAVICASGFFDPDIGYSRHPGRWLKLSGNRPSAQPTSEVLALKIAESFYASIL